MSIPFLNEEGISDTHFLIPCFRNESGIALVNFCSLICLKKFRKCTYSYLNIMNSEVGEQNLLLHRNVKLHPLVCFKVKEWLFSVSWPYFLKKVTK